MTTRVEIFVETRRYAYVEAGSKTRRSLAGLRSSIVEGLRVYCPWLIANNIVLADVPDLFLDTVYPPDAWKVQEHRIGIGLTFASDTDAILFRMMFNDAVPVWRRTLVILLTPRRLEAKSLLLRLAHEGIVVPVDREASRKRQDERRLNTSNDVSNLGRLLNLVS